MRLRALAPGKVNLGLFVGPLRDDAKHELATAIESVSLADELTLSTGSEITADVVICSGVEGRNLVEDALFALRESGWNASAVKVEILKRIPVAGGMGGGSADAAAVLRMATAIGGVPIGAAARIAGSLGVDVPSQLAPGLVLATGAGETIEAREPLGAHALLVVPLRSTLATADVYAKADELGLPRDSDDVAARTRELDRALGRGARLPAELLVNDLERAAVALRPEVANVLGEARATGADHAFVCGSGPTVAGLFWGQDANDRAFAGAAQLTPLYPDAQCALPVASDFGMPERI